MTHIAWALLGMAGYSAVTLLVKLATRTGDFNAFAVLAVATGVVAVSALANAVLGGAFAGKTGADFLRPGALYAYAAGIALTIAVGRCSRASRSALRASSCRSTGCSSSAAACSASSCWASR
ncbi:hypothetical protein [Methylobacterium haplocladii]|nr:hypothetical protein [Methylobacterium haplocladii]GJD83210.1 hypothetical protein HPGCJGGD_1076 [Methylobacterium haplocladii]